MVVSFVSKADQQTRAVKTISIFCQQRELDSKLGPGAPKVTQEAPKVTPGAPKVTPGAPKVSPGAPKVSPRAPKVSPGSSKSDPRELFSRGSRLLFSFLRVISSFSEFSVFSRAPGEPIFRSLSVFHCFRGAQRRETLIATQPIRTGLGSGRTQSLSNWVSK